MNLLLKKETLLTIEWISEQNKNFAAELENKFCKTHLSYKNLRCLGTILAFEIAQGRDEYLNNISVEITHKSLQAGVYLRPLGNTVYIMPPYCITEKELRRVYDVILKILTELNFEAMNASLKPDSERNQFQAESDHL